MIRPKNYQVASIRENRGLVTNLDAVDQSENYCRDCRNVVFNTPGFLGSRRFGTQKRYDTLPTTLNTPSAVTLVDGHHIFNPSTGTEHLALVSIDANTMTKVHVDSSTTEAGTWQDLTRIIKTTIDAVGAANSVYFDVLETAVLEDNVQVALATDECKGWIAYNIDRVEAMMITDVDQNTPDASHTRITVFGSPVESGWAATDVVLLVRSNYVFRDILTVAPNHYGIRWATTLGALFVRWNQMDGQRKVTVFPSSVSAALTPDEPMRIQHNDERSYFYISSTPRYTLPAGWYASPVKQVSEFNKVGGSDLNQPITPASGAQTVSIDDGDGHSWLKIVAEVEDDTALTRDGSLIVYTHAYVVVKYDDYQRSDPIFQIYALRSAGTFTPRIDWDFFVAPGKMNPLVSGLEIYAATITETEWTTVGIREPADSEYRLVKAISFREDNDSTITTTDLSTTATDDLTVKLEYALLPAFGSWDYVTENLPVWLLARVPGLAGARVAVAQSETGAAVTDFIGHAVLKVRSSFNSRFIARGKRSQGAVNVRDQDDNTLRISAYSGLGAHMDDVFPDVNLDSAGFRQKLFLNGRGPLLGLTVHGPQVRAFKGSEIEIISLETGEQTIIGGADVTAIRGILSTPYGDVWVGQRGIYMLPVNGPNIDLLNLPWRNLFDGTLRTPDGTQYITDAYRTAAIAGYDQHDDVAWFQIQTNITSSTSEYLCYCYSFQEKKWWIVKLNIGAPSPVVAFTQKNDKTFTIIYSTGVLKYPLKLGNLRYEDDVTAAGATASKGIETFVEFVHGSLYGLHNQITLWDVLVDHQGESVNAAGKYELEMYANDDATAFNSSPAQQMAIDSPAFPMLAPKRGMIDRLRLKLKLPTATLTNFRKWDIRTIETGYVPHQRIGTR